LVISTEEEPFTFLGKDMLKRHWNDLDLCCNVFFGTICYLLKNTIPNQPLDQGCQTHFWRA
jgi:hypothetical protein